MTKIEWAEETWNPVIGCTKIAPGCKNCYAIGHVHRMAGNPNAKIAAANAGLTIVEGGKLNWTGKITCLPDRLQLPLRRKAATTYFVNSLSDLFHADVPDDFILSVFQQIGKCPRHRFIVLTKRGARMADFVSRRRWRNLGHSLAMGGDHHAAIIPGEHRDTDTQYLPNVILGASASDQATYDAAAPHMRALAKNGWNTVWSLEPLLGPVDLRLSYRPGLGPSVDGFCDHEEECDCNSRPSWVIVGGESGPGARPMRSDWVRSIRDQCLDAGVAFFFKQWGEYLPDDQNPAMTPPHAASGAVRVGKKAAGRLLDGREWSELPEVLR